MLKGATPMLARRVRVCGASLVCRVDRTRCPVWAALTAISAVSRSRISPTMMMSGSWRRKARRAEAKVSPVLGFMLTWLIPVTWISTGSSTVEMLTSGLLRIFSAEYSETVLPEPVGPVTRIIP